VKSQEECEECWMWSWCVTVGSGGDKVTSILEE
jgi:hypothetical protein